MEQPSGLLLRGSTRVSYKLSLLLVSPILVALMNNSSVSLISLELESKVFLYWSYLVGCLKLTKWG
jgi:hypothetical protein